MAAAVGARLCYSAAVELQTEHRTGEAAPSASVILLRDGPQGLETFLVRRHRDSAVLGGVHVFPGGKVDDEDAGLAARLDRAAQELQARLGEPELSVDAAAALHVAAIRELHEETGVLCAAVAPAQARAAWAALRQGRRFAELLATADWTLQASRLFPWSRWITPVVGGVGRKRFDTRFFVATVPPGQDAAHDEHEATASVWLAPRAALLQYWEGTIELAPPQIMTLQHLARHQDAAGVLRAAGERPPPCVRQHPIAAGGGRILCYPGDPEHPEQERVMPGPLRLAWRGTRFEPHDGLAALLPD